jgi:hypothetical protein
MYYARLVSGDVSRIGVPNMGYTIIIADDLQECAMITNDQPPLGRSAEKSYPYPK